MDLPSVVKALQAFAPLKLAEKWDNVGLLVDVAEPAKKVVNKIILTNDLTEEVMDEAIEERADVILSYHPPIFQAFKSITTQTWKGRVLLKAIAHNIAVYSPHTAFDSMVGGVNDWLADGLGAGKRVPITPYDDATLAAEKQYKLVTFLPEAAADRVREALSAAGAGHIGDYTQCSFSTPGMGTFFGAETTRPAVGEAGRLERAPELRLEMVFPATSLKAVAEALRQTHPYETPAWDVVPLVPLPGAGPAVRPDPKLVGAGQGRIVTLDEPAPLLEIVARIKKHIGVPHVRVAVPPSASSSAAPLMVRTVAMCAGAGGSELSKTLSARGNQKPQLLWTGEWRHHDVLDAVADGAAVVLCDHSNTERGYLKIVRERLAGVLEGKVEVVVSRKDVTDPLVVM